MTAPDKIYLATTEEVQNLDNSFVGIAHSDPEDIVNPVEYVRKDAIVAEIERRRDAALMRQQNLESIGQESVINEMVAFELNRIISFLDTLEVKEVDLEKEIDNYIYTNNGRQRLALELDWKQCNITFNGGKLIDFAKHFFELGMRFNNPITAADRGMAEEITINLKRVEQDYHINLTREMEWLRNKVKKGE